MSKTILICVTLLFLFLAGCSYEKGSIMDECGIMLDNFCDSCYKGCRNIGGTMMGYDRAQKKWGSETVKAFCNCYIDGEIVNIWE